MAPESEGLIMKSAGTKWRQFKSKLTSEYVKPYAGQKKNLSKPPRKYAFVGKEHWRRFVAERTTTDWGVCFLNNPSYLYIRNNHIRENKK